jgi:hypothetical protein
MDSQPSSSDTVLPGPQEDTPAAGIEPASAVEPVVSAAEINVPVEAPEALTEPIVIPQIGVVEAPPCEDASSVIAVAPLTDMTPPAKPRKRHIGLIVAVAVVVVLLAAGGGFAYLRMNETRLLDQAQAGVKNSDWASALDACAQLAALPVQNLLVEPQRCLPLTGEAFYQTSKPDQALSDL